MAATEHRPRDKLDLHSLGRAHPMTAASMSTHSAGVWFQGSKNQLFSTLLFFPVSGGKEAKPLGFIS